MSGLRRISRDEARELVTAAKRAGSGVILIETPAATTIDSGAFFHEVAPIPAEPAIVGILESLGPSACDAVQLARRLVQAASAPHDGLPDAVALLDRVRVAFASASAGSPVIVKFASIRALDPLTVRVVRGVLDHSEGIGFVFLFPCDLPELSDGGDYQGLYGLLELCVQIMMWNRVAMVVETLLSAEDRIRDERLRGLIEFRAGMLSVRQGRPAEAAKYYRAAIDRFERSDDQEQLVKGLNNLGNLHVHGGEFAEARKCFARALALGEDLQSNYHLAVTYGNYAQLMLKQRRPAQAYGNLRKSLVFIARSGFYRDAHYTYAAFGDCFEQQGDEIAAESAYRKAIEIGEWEGNVRDLGADCVRLARFYIRHERLSEASAVLVRAEEIFRRVNHVNGLLDAVETRIELEIARGDKASAIRALAEAARLPGLAADDVARIRVEEMRRRADFL